MKNKILIGAGILLTVFIIFLIAICGSSTGSKTLPKEELEQTIDYVSCNVIDEDPIQYDFSILSNDTEFDTELYSKNYSNVNINNLKNIKTYGVSFRVKTDEDTVMNIMLTKNGEIISNQTIEAQEGVAETVNLVLENSFEVSTLDNLSIVFENTSESAFVFDTMIFFFDEV